MLKTRLATAAILLPLLLLLIIEGPSWAMGIMLMACVGLATYELSSMILPALERRFVADGNDQDWLSGTRWLWICVGVGLQLFYLAAFVPGSVGRSGIVLVLALLITAALFLCRGIDRSMFRLMGFLTSVCLGSLPWLSIWDIYLMADNRSYLMLTLAIVFLNDTGGYFGGRRFGKMKLAPTISPNKTWEGALFGLAGATAGAFAINGIYGFTLGPWWLMVLAATIGGSFGILGDLSISMVKRFAGLKDTGAIFPGHGGFLDRADAFLLAAPLIWFILHCYSGLSSS